MKKQNWFLIIVLTAFFVAGILAKTTFNRTWNGRHGYTLTSEVTEYDADGKATHVYTGTIHMSAGGDWHSIKTYRDGTVVEMFGVLGRGAFAKHGGKLSFASSYDSPRPILVSDGFLKSPDYLRTETVLGYPAFVTKAGIDSQLEVYSAPVIDGATIKFVNKSGSKVLVSEPTNLVFGEPDPLLLKMPEDLPIDYEHFNRAHSQP